MDPHACVCNPDVIVYNPDVKYPERYSDSRSPVLTYRAGLTMKACDRSFEIDNNPGKRAPILPAPEARRIQLLNRAQPGPELRASMLLSNTYKMRLRYVRQHLLGETPELCRCNVQPVHPQGPFAGVLGLLAHLRVAVVYVRRVLHKPNIRTIVTAGSATHLHAARSAYAFCTSTLVGRRRWSAPNMSCVYALQRCMPAFGRGMC